MVLETREASSQTSRRAALSRRTLIAGAMTAGAGLSSVLASSTLAAGTSPQSGKSVVAQDKVQITFMSRGGEYITGVVDQQIAAFNEVYPDIEVRQDSAAGDFVQRIQLDAAAGTLSDAWFDANRTTGPFFHAGLIEDLDPYLEADPSFIEDEFIEQAFIAQTYNDSRWGLPWDSGAMGMIYNIDLLNEAGVPLPDSKTPMTWDELLEISKQLTRDLDGRHPGDDGFDPSAIQVYGLQTDLTNGLPQWVQSNGGDIIEPDPDGNEVLISPIDTPEAIEAFQFLADLGTVHFVSPSPKYVQSQEISLASSTVAISHNGVWQLGRLNDAGINWGVAPFPIQKIPVSYGHYSPLVLSASSEKKPETFTYILWASLSKAGQQILVDLGMQQPTRKDLTESFIDSSTPPATEYRQAFYDVWNPETFRWPGDNIGSYWNGWAQNKNNLWATELDPLWAGDIRYEEIATEFRQKTEQVLRTGEA